ncbi:MAG: hypothetical protein HQL29_02800 [Candidatus Omnitrophica bacterium]|nr:hypothetical protein [Candidatus Omnitrophota bacterium]
MEVYDYYTESFATKVTYGLGKGARTVQSVASQINLVQGAAAVMLLWGSIVGIKNYKKCKNGYISKGDAVKDTARESVGMGLSAGLGLVADTVIKTVFLSTVTTTFIPFAVGVAVTSTAKITWDRITKKKLGLSQYCCAEGLKPALVK